MAARTLTFAAALASLLLAALPALAQPRVELLEPPGQPLAVRICGAPSERPGDGIEIHALENGAPADAGALADLPPLWGEYSLERSTGRRCTIFVPRHQPAPGMDLVVSCCGQILARLERPAAAAKVRVEEIYPSGHEIPANLLRLYVSFTGQMSLKGVEQHVHLRDAAGNEIPTAFVDVPEGLWDPSRRRLTLLLHPGRVKSGIEVGEELGPVLREGEEVSLEVDAGARDADGAPLLAGGERRWKIGKPQKAPLAAEQFRLAVKDGALAVEAEVALDRALALGAFRVLQDGAGIAGDWTLDAGERRLRFQPAQPWRRGETYLLRIGQQLEDVAGNRLGRAFEMESGQDTEVEAAEIPFAP